MQERSPLASPFALVAGLLLIAAAVLAGCAGGGGGGGFGGSGDGLTGGTTGGTGGGSTRGTVGSTTGSGGNNYLYTMSFGSKGSADGQLGAPRGIAQDSSGNIYVTDGAGQIGGGEGNNRIEVFSPQGTFVKTITASGQNSAKFTAPTSIAVDSSGSLYCVVSPGVVLQLTSAGAVNGTIGSQGSGTGQYQSPYNVSCGANGLLYVADYVTGQIDEYNTSGVFQSAVGAGTLLQPAGVVADSAGDVFVTDNGHARIVKFSPAGAVVKAFGPNPGQVVNLQGIAVDGSGNVYVSDAANDVVTKYDNNGTFLASFGSPGTGNGQFTGPGDLMVDSKGNVYVVDTGNDRVEVFAP